MSLPHSLVVPTHGHSRCILPAGCVPLKRGFALSIPADMGGEPKWRLQELVDGARLVAVNASCASGTTFTHESAMLAHGLRPLAPNPDVLVRAPYRRPALALPGIDWNGVRIDSARLTQTRTALVLRDVMDADGVAADSLEATAIAMALHRPLPDAVAAVGQILRRLSHFDRFSSAASQSREDIVRARLLELLAEEGRGRVLRGLRGAESIIRFAQAGCESPGESRLLAVLLTLFPHDVQTQFEILAGGQRYFADFAIPCWKVIIEFDGLIKMGSNEQEFRRAQADLMARQRALEDSGWTVVRVGWNDVLQVDVLRAKLLRRILAVQSKPELPGRTAGEFLALEKQRAGSRAHRRRTR